MIENRKLAGRSILITGAASGIGKATAKLFAGHGAKLGLLDIAEGGLTRLGDMLGVPTALCDLADSRATEGAVQRLAVELGRIDGVINCAGVGLSAKVEDVTDEIWVHTLEINLSAPFRICRAALPWLRREPSATIVNVASAQGLLPNIPGVSAYAASKAGLIGFTKALAAELGPDIRANILCPGLTETSMAPEELRETIADNYALKRIANPAEMASALLFLTSSDSSFVTGTVLAVDGGRTFH